jgi:hypothetical protein
MIQTTPAQERLRCTACDRACSEREDTLMARSKLPEDTSIRLVQCQRWGVCDAGTADIWAAALQSAPVPRTRPRRGSRRASRVPGRFPCVFPMGGRLSPRRCCRWWGLWIGGDGVGRADASRSRGWERRRPCFTPRWSRSATRLARSWRAAGAWSAVAHAVLASHGACATWARRSRPP